jgi:hypothetical protein
MGKYKIFKIYSSESDYVYINYTQINIIDKLTTLKLTKSKYKDDINFYNLLSCSTVNIETIEETDNYKDIKNIIEKHKHIEYALYNNDIVEPSQIIPELKINEMEKIDDYYIPLYNRIN